MELYPQFVCVILSKSQVLWAQVSRLASWEWQYQVKRGNKYNILLTFQSSSYSENEMIDEHRGSDFLWVGRSHLSWATDLHYYTTISWPVWISSFYSLQFIVLNHCFMIYAAFLKLYIKRGLDSIGRFLMLLLKCLDNTFLWLQIEVK